MQPPIDQTIGQLRTTAAALLGVSPERVASRCRRPRIALARQLAMTAARRQGYSFPEIGRAFERNHSTVMHAVREITDRASDDERIAAMVDTLVAQLPPRREVSVSSRSATPAPRWNGWGTPPAAATVPPPPPAPPPPAPRRKRPHHQPRRLLREPVGQYRTASGETRQVVLTVRDSKRVLLDRGPGDAGLVVEEFGTAAGLLEVAAIARGYIAEAGRAGRPTVRAAA